MNELILAALFFTPAVWLLGAAVLSDDASDEDDRKASLVMSSVFIVLPLWAVIILIA
jgi:hypothetical protein